MLSNILRVNTNDFIMNIQSPITLKYSNDGIEDNHKKTLLTLK